jgi:hypothetical protein
MPIVICSPSFLVGRSSIGVDFVLDIVDVSLLLLLFVLIDGSVSKYHLASLWQKLCLPCLRFVVNGDDFDLRVFECCVDAFDVLAERGGFSGGNSGGVVGFDPSACVGK